MQRLELLIKSHYQDKRRRRDAEALARRLDLWQRYPELEELEFEWRRAQADRLSATREPSLIEEKDAALDAVEKKRAAFLAAHDLNENYLSPREDCSYCHDHGYVGESVCPKCFRKNLAELLLDLHMDAHLDLEGQFSRFEPERYSDQELSQVDLVNRLTQDEAQAISGLSVRALMKQNMRSLYRYAVMLSRLRSRVAPSATFDLSYQAAGVKKDLPLGYYLCGGTGSGKTFALSCVANLLLEQGVSIQFLRASQLARILSEDRQLARSFSQDARRLSSVREQLQQVQMCEVLLIDDLGTELDRYPDFAEDLLDLLSLRQQGHRPCLISSNFDYDAIQAIYGSRLTSRLLGSYRRLLFLSEDLRTYQGQE